jgi:hypothetical protein
MQGAGIRAENGPGPWPRAHPGPPHHDVEGTPNPLLVEGPAALRCPSSASSGSQANETEPESLSSRFLLYPGFNPDPASC